MMAVREEDRELLLSMYLDGELEPGLKAAVEEKLRADPAWKADFEDLQSAHRRISRVVESNWHDEVFTDKLLERVAERPRPSTAKARAAAEKLAASELDRERERQARRAREARVRRLGLTAAAAAIVLFAATGYLLLNPGTGGGTPPVVAQRELLGRFDASAASTAGGASGGELRARDRLEAQPGRAAWIKLKDGTVLWLGGGGVLEARDARRLELREGRVLIQVAKGPTAFRVDLADGTHVEALGTRFEVELAAGGPRVRVVEGRVRRSGEGKSADARGGQEIGSDFAVRAFDPREVLAPWLDAARPDPDAALGALPSAPWPQLGGSPGHTGVTPVRGPAALVAEAFYPFPRVEGGGEAPQYAPAVVDARERVFVLRRADAERSQLWVLDLRAGERAWKPCGEPVLGLSQNPPVVTPRGLVALGVSIMTGPNVVAWDPGLGRVAWTKDVGSSVYALTAAHDGAVICSTFQRVVALDELDGQERWSFAHESVSEVQAPACVLENGEVVIASRAGRLVRLAPDGKLMKDAGWNSQQGLFWPPVARGDGSAWIACPLGDVGCWKADGAADVLLSGAQASTWPLGNDVLALGPALQLGRGVKAELAGSSPVQALALDGRGFLYVGAHATLSRYRYDAKAFAAGRPPATDALSPVQQGEIVRGGIAILPDRLVVTTTEGVQLFK